MNDEPRKYRVGEFVRLKAKKKIWRNAFGCVTKIYKRKKWPYEVSIRPKKADKGMLILVTVGDEHLEKYAPAR